MWILHKPHECKGNRPKAETNTIAKPKSLSFGNSRAEKSLGSPGERLSSSNDEIKTMPALLRLVLVIRASSTGPDAFIEVWTTTGERTAFRAADGVGFGIKPTGVKPVQVTNGKPDKIGFCGQTCKKSRDAFEDKIPETEKFMV